MQQHKQMIATECCSQHSMFWFNIRCNQNAANRKTIAHSFCHCINICIYTCMISSEEFSASSKTTLHFICNKYGIIFIAQTSYQF